MSKKKKKDDSGKHMAFTLATTGGVLVLRKVLAALWTKVVGKEPPTDVTDPKVSLAEAVAWAAATAIIVETARFGIAQATGHRRAEPVEAADTESD